MDVHVEETEEGYRFDVYTDKEVALVIRGDEERIYLPDSSRESSSYYTENYEGLIKVESGYRLYRKKEFEDYTVLG
ncbi:MAG: hypothetical protein ABEK00_00055 [Candidatus Nanohaloarchaea archaeon]